MGFDIRGKFEGHSEVRRCVFICYFWINDNMCDNQNEPACGVLSLLDISNHSNNSECVLYCDVCDIDYNSLWVFPDWISVQL